VSAPGKVYLVGAGPGDPGLITVAGLERLKEADVVVYDRLVAPALLNEAHPEADLIFVGKVAGESHDQEAINRLLIEKAGEGKSVVRLKGGDPFVFGRGGEEAEALRAAGIAFEIVPGVTSAIAVPAYAGIPVTHRGLASTFAVITGHEAEPSPPAPLPCAGEGGKIDWGPLATAVDTLVFLMGTKTLSEIVEKLIANGRVPETPVAVIRWGTTPEQRTVTGTLADIVERVRDAGLTPPAITVVGEVVRLREKLSWFAGTGARLGEERPLFGKRVLITRTRRQASVLARLLAAEGAIPIELPAIEIEPAVDADAVAAAIQGLRAGCYTWAVFTSANAVELWFEHLRERGLDARAFVAAKVAAIGPATAEALAERGITADVVPEEYVAEAVVEALREAPIRPGDRILVPRAESARPELVEGLRSRGCQVDEVTLYRAAVPETAPAEALSLLRDGRIDIVTFTSSSTVRNLAAMLNGSLTPGPSPDARERGVADMLRGSLVACIGPITAKAAEELGLRVDVVASEYTVEGLVRALVSHPSDAAGQAHRAN
jgi:uroporphyrinogen III methyltransferase/synthase